MDFAITLKFVHVTAAILWVGGGFGLLLAGILRGNRASAEELMGIFRLVAYLGPRFLMPVSLLTLATGLALVFVAGWGWQPFTVLGLAGVAFTAGFGNLVLGPSCAQAVALADDKGPAAALPLMRRVFRLARLDYAVQFGVVFLMVVRPDWSELAVMGGLATVLALAALATFRPVRHAV